MKKITEADVNQVIKIRDDLIKRLSRIKTKETCKECFSDYINNPKLKHHVCCIDCDYITKKGHCKSPNINCTLWMCDRLIKKLPQDLIDDLSLMAAIMIKNGWNFYRMPIKLIQFYHINKNKNKLKRRTYYGSLAKHYIKHFNFYGAINWWIKIRILLFLHKTRLRLKTLLNRKVYTNE